MIVKCGVNGETLDEDDIFVCHHCGMPVCEEHGWVVGEDDAFADFAWVTSAPSGLTPASVTPPDHWTAFRSTVATLASAALGRIRHATKPRADLTVPRPAMHCRECVEKVHKRAGRRHGWADPRPATGGFARRVGRP